MGSAFHQLCPRYTGTLTPTAPTAMGNLNFFKFVVLYVRNIYRFNLNTVNSIYSIYYIDFPQVRILFHLHTLLKGQHSETIGKG